MSGSAHQPVMLDGLSGTLNRPCYPLGGEVSEWLMVPLSKSGERRLRGFESHPLRQGLASSAGDARLGSSAPLLTYAQRTVRRVLGPLLDLPRPAGGARPRELRDV